MKKMTVTAIVSTRNRYFTTLPLCLSAIATQTVKPDRLIIFDDGDHVDLREDPTYSSLFSLFYKNNIDWEVAFGEGLGQVKNHQTAIGLAKTDFIWRLDDDNVPESNVLETLLKYASDEKVGAVGGLVMDPREDIKPNKLASNKMDNFFIGLNEQWFLPTEDYETKSVDHLYSSFLFRVKAAKHGYCQELSRVGHREETIFTYEMKLEGWEILITPKCTTWHFRNPVGGIRDETREEMWIHDEQIFQTKLKNWKLNIKEPKYIVLNNGLGDHFMFKSILPKIKEKYKDLVLAVCYPSVFENENIPLISIADATNRFGDLSRWNVYKFMAERNWGKHVTEAFLEMYL